MCYVCDLSGIYNGVIMIEWPEKEIEKVSNERFKENLNAICHKCIRFNEKCGSKYMLTVVNDKTEIARVIKCPGFSVTKD